jgi:hypothetical protein
MAAPLGFKTFATGDVLTAADTNGYLMQGVWTFADAAARDAAVTSPQEGNMCYLKDTNAVQYYSGSAWVAVSSGGMTSIASGSLTGSSVVINSIPGTYKNLQLVLRDYYMSTNGSFSLKVNAIANYNLIRDIVNANVVTRDGLTGNGNFSLAYNNIAQSDNDSATIVNIYDYTSSVNKNINALISYTNTSAAKDFMNYNGNAVMNAAVTSVTLTTSAGNFSGGTYILYGVN